MQNHNIQLVTIFAGYASTGILSAATQRWIAALHSISHRMVMVFDQNQLLTPPACVVNDSSVYLLCEKHGAYDFGSYQRGLAFAEQHSRISPLGLVAKCIQGRIQKVLLLDTLANSLCHLPSCESSGFNQYSLLSVIYVRFFFPFFTKSPKRCP